MFSMLPIALHPQLKNTCYRWTSGTAEHPTRPLSPPPPPWPTPTRTVETSAEPLFRSPPKSRTRFAAAAVASSSSGESYRWTLTRRLLRRGRPVVGFVHTRARRFRGGRLTGCICIRREERGGKFWTTAEFVESSSARGKGRQYLDDRLR